MRAPGGYRVGAWPETVGHVEQYFLNRGGLTVAETSRWGVGVTVITQSHDTGDWPIHGEIVDRPVIVRGYAWIGSRSILCGCDIGEGAIVATGTVVRCQNVAAYTMVGGNPARVIARWVDGEWAYLPADQSGYGRALE